MAEGCKTFRIYYGAGDEALETVLKGVAPKMTLFELVMWTAVCGYHVYK